MWVTSLREVVFAKLRVLFDFLQLTGLQVLVKSAEPEWFVTGILSLAGGVIGGGLGIQTWLPFLCALQNDYYAAFWVHASVLLLVFPFALVVAIGARYAAQLVWKGSSGGLLRVLSGSQPFTTCLGVCAMCVFVPCV